MTRRAARFTQADLDRAVRAAHRAPAPRAVEITPEGTIRIVPVDHKADQEGLDNKAASNADDDRIMRGLDRLNGKKANKRRVAPA